MTVTEFTTYTRDNLNIDVTLNGIERYLEKYKAKWQGWEIDTISSYAKIDWQFFIEIRTWGVKSFGVYATKCALDILVEYYTKESVESIEFDLSNDISEFEIDTHNLKEKQDSFEIESVDIDFTTQKINVYF